MGNGGDAAEKQGQRIKGREDFHAVVAIKVACAATSILRDEEQAVDRSILPTERLWTRSELELDPPRSVA